MRNSRTLVMILALAAAPTTAHADGGPFGLGLVLGQPTGITGAYRLSDHATIDAAVGLDVLNDYHRFYVHADYLFVLPDLIGSDSVALKPYLGPGAYLTANAFGLGARLPIGLSLEFHRAPLQLFLEVIPSVHLVHSPVTFGVGAALGFRYYF